MVRPAEWESKRDFFKYIMEKDTEVRKLAEWIEVRIHGHLGCMLRHTSLPSLMTALYCHRVQLQNVLHMLNELVQTTIHSHSFKCDVGTESPMPAPQQTWKCQEGSNTVECVVSKL